MNAIFPRWCRGLPVLTLSRIDNARSSRAIDSAVRAVIEDALSLYTVDEARLAELRSGSDLDSRSV